MTDTREVPKDDFLTLTRAAETIGCSRPTLRSRIRSGDLVMWMNPADRRQRLISSQDLAQFRQPQPAPPIEAA